MELKPRKTKLRPFLALLMATLALGACGKAPAPGAAPDASGDQAGAPTEASGGGASDLSLEFDGQAEGQAPAELAPVLGTWLIAAPDGEEGAPVVAYDGAADPLAPAPDLDTLGQALFGELGGIFAAGVQAAPLYALAILRPLDSLSAGRVSLRFKPDGSGDQAAGIAFALRPNGDYMVVRANGPEQNLVMLRVAAGRRDMVAKQVGQQIEPLVWHDLTLTIDGNSFRAAVDDQPPLEVTLDRPPAGRIGLWAVSDRQVLFDDVEVDGGP